MKDGFVDVDTLGFSSGLLGFIIEGAAVGDRLGESVSGAGDVDGDGYADVIVSAPQADPNGRDSAGAVYVLLGKASGFTTVDLANFVPGDSMGFVIQVCVCVYVY
jgi:hypothetical protein